MLLNGNTQVYRMCISLSIRGEDAYAKATDGVSWVGPEPDEANRSLTVSMMICKIIPKVLQSSPSWEIRFDAILVVITRRPK